MAKRYLRSIELIVNLQKKILTKEKVNEILALSEAWPIETEPDMLDDYVSQSILQCDEILTFDTRLKNY